MRGEIFNDVRISRRIADLSKSMVEKESVVIHRLARNEAEQRSFYRLLHNPRLETGQVVEFMRQDCLRQLQPGAHYLVVQDTTQPNFERNSKNIASRQELGVIGDRKSLGFFLHPSLVVQAENGRCLGYSDVATWSRDIAAPDRHERGYKNQPIEQKESYRWIRSALTSTALLARAGMVTHVCDREGDIAELLLRVPDEQKGCHLLVRSSSDRLLWGGAGKLSTLLASLPETGRHSILIKGDVRTGRQQREAALSLRYSKVSLQLKKEKRELYVVEAKELQAPQGGAPIYWRLLTTHPVARLEEAVQLLEWYAMRWNIEQVFRLLKQKGLNVEASEVETGKGLVQLTLLALFAASKIMLLHLASRQETPTEVAGAFTDEQLSCLEAVNKEYEGKTQRQQNPYPTRTLQYCYWVLARLGGWKPQEKQAGVITLHRGFMDFHKIFDGWTLVRKLVS